MHHRSKKRIKELGEVFTPEYSANEMLDIIAPKDSEIWSDVETCFFEPTCGHGNFVELILKRRLESIYKSSLKQKNRSPVFHAIANATNTIWAIDIDPTNINHCRSRCYKLIVEFALKYSTYKTEYDLIHKNKEFFAHIICALNWHISINDALTALSDDKNVRTNSKKTIYSEKFFESNGHKPIELQFTWVDFYEASTANKIIPLEFKRQLAAIEKKLKKKSITNLYINYLHNEVA